MFIEFEYPETVARENDIVVLAGSVILGQRGFYRH